MSDGPSAGGRSAEQGGRATHRLGRRGAAPTAWEGLSSDRVRPVSCSGCGHSLACKNDRQDACRRAYSAPSLCASSSTTAPAP